MTTTQPAGQDQEASSAALDAVTLALQIDLMSAVNKHRVAFSEAVAAHPTSADAPGVRLLCLLTAILADNFLNDVHASRSVVGLDADTVAVAKHCWDIGFQIAVATIEDDGFYFERVARQ